VNRDSEFLSGNFFILEVPKSRRFLLKYFKTPLQRAFLKYFLVFGSTRNFIDHTGFYCSRRLLVRMVRNFKRLVKVYDDAKFSLSEEGMETIGLLEKGDLRLTSLMKY
jgi:hypothetical protein